MKQNVVAESPPRILAVGSSGLLDQLALRTVTEVDSPEQGERLGMAMKELERVTRMLNNLVEESRLVPERPRCLQVVRVIEDLVELLRYQLSNNICLTINVPGNLYCRLPEAEFRHVLLNLVLNAEQAIGKAPGNINISAAVEDGRVRLTVSDDGPGIPTELLESGIHEHGTWRKEGTGLGLAAVRRFALAHGGSLELQNAPEDGANVFLTLPLDYRGN